MNNSKYALIIFAKNPEKGKVKTRLAKSLGDDNALMVYKKLLDTTYLNTKETIFTKFLFLSDTPDENIFDKDFSQHIQCGNDLGERMLNAFHKISDMGFEKICIIGVDCPDINEKILEQAFESLNSNDFVLGPAIDGGYYLLGMKNVLNDVFRNISWGSNTVLKETIAGIVSHGKSFALLEPLRDIDTLEDLMVFIEKNFVFPDIIR